MPFQSAAFEAATHAQDADFTTSALQRYCGDCHDAASRSGDLFINTTQLNAIGAHAEKWEKVAHKLRAGAMPPPDAPRPDAAGYDRMAHFLERALDDHAAKQPDAGRVPQFHRLTRTEYRNAIRDLLRLEHLPAEMDFELLLPADNATSGFDNIADLLFVSPVVMERYLEAARRISRLAVGDKDMPVLVNRYRMPLELPQDQAFDGLPAGTRGGLATTTWFPLDGEYLFRIDMAGTASEPHALEIAIDGERVASTATGVRMGAPRTQDALEFRLPVKAGTRDVAVTFVRRTLALDESIVRVQRRSRGELPAMELITISGPYNATGPGHTPSRERIFQCTPNSADEEASCARSILASLARHAYRRPANDADLDTLWPFFEEGRNAGGFESGIQRALERLLVSPQFLYRIERVPEGTTVDTPFAVAPVELASRLSFFLWSSLPDEELLDLAIDGSLANDAVLHAQVRRMLADPRAGALVKNFATQWLFLGDVELRDPDVFLFRDYDRGLRTAFIRETQLFVASILLDGRGIHELISADYTYLNERLADHYGIPHVKGGDFRRVTLPPGSPRGGLLGHGSILTLTSYPTRTSPVLRGKFVLDNLLASPPPPPPPDVPALEVEVPDERAELSLRDALAMHRESPDCAGCHAQMDPIGLAFEHFDAVGRWRDSEAGLAIDAASELPDGQWIHGVEDVKRLLLETPERFAMAVTEKLLMYAIGRNVHYYDMPAVRAIVREAAADNYTFEALVLGIVDSVPFRMRMATTTEVLAASPDIMGER